jgi:hypothetical protein
MGFGQYSGTSEGKLTKRDMVAELVATHGAIITANKTENNTLRAKLADGREIVRFHHTDIVTIAKRGAITVTTGGWRSVTTKERLNIHLPAGWNVYSGTGTWLIRTPAGTYPFADGARFAPDGRPLNPALLYREEKRVLRDKALVAKFLKKAREKGWADPAGDPWVFSQPSRQTMMDWLKTGYFTARLMQLALESRFKEGGVSIYMSDIARNKGKPRSAFETGILRKYIYKSLGVA